MKGFHIGKQLKKNYRTQNIPFIHQPIPTEKTSLERKLKCKANALYAFENDSVLVEAAEKEENSTTKSMEKVEMKKSKNNLNSFLSSNLPLNKQSSVKKQNRGASDQLFQRSLCLMAMGLVLCLIGLLFLLSQASLQATLGALLISFGGLAFLIGFILLMVYLIFY
jgi:predicted RND superfamily exporter protein